MLLNVPHKKKTKEITSKQKLEKEKLITWSLGKGRSGSSSSGNECEAAKVRKRRRLMSFILTPAYGGGEEEQGRWKLKGALNTS